MDFTYRTEQTYLRELFPRFNADDARQHFSHLQAKDPRQKVLNVIQHMWEGS